MRLLVVAMRTDTLAAEAVNFIKQSWPWIPGVPLSWRLLYVHILEGGIAPRGSLALFSVPEEEFRFPNTHLRIVAFSALKVAPAWARSTPFLIALRRNDQSLEVTKEELIRVLTQYVFWTPNSRKIPPWGGNGPTSSEKKDDFEEWWKDAVIAYDYIMSLHK